MLSEILGPVTEYFKDKPYWPAIKGLFTLLSLYLSATVLAYEYLHWEYGLEPPLGLFLRSYLFKQISVVAATIFVISLFFQLAERGQGDSHDDAIATSLRKYSRALGKRLAITGLVLCFAVPVFHSLAPQRASNISILFLDDPSQEFDREAFVYLLYELNQRQKQWHFQVDFDVFNPNLLNSAERKACEVEQRALCYAELKAAGHQLIAVTTKPLDPDHFWVNRGSTSVITTSDWKPFVPPSHYEYLIYSVLTQSMVLHLNNQCSGIPATSFRESRDANGDLFEYSPRRYAMKPAILAAHLSPTQEEMLMNCFGAEYLKTSSSLLTLDWLRSDAMQKNLEKNFPGVRSRPAEASK